MGFVVYCSENNGEIDRFFEPVCVTAYISDFEKEQGCQVEKRTTIYDIASKLGISTATVNRALTGKTRVKQETRDLVLKTAKEMGFRPNALARSLASRKLRFAVLAFTSFPEFHEHFLRGARNAG